MRKRKVISLLLACTLAGNPVWAQLRRADTPPKLVIQLVIGSVGSNQLRSVWEELSTEGFHRIESQGVKADHTQQPQQWGSSIVGCANLISGAPPSRHGVVGSHWYQAVNGRRIPIIEDRDYAPIGGSGRGRKVSPLRIEVPTLNEAWREAFPEARIYSFSLNPEEALLLGGRAADAAFWLDPATGLFITSDYYCNATPTWLRKFNSRGLATQYLTQPWTPSWKGNHPRSSSTKRQKQLPQSFTEVKLPGRKYLQLGARYHGNTLLKDLITTAIVSDSLGQRTHGDPDLLSVYFTSCEIVNMVYGPESAQAKDALIRLDQEIGQLLSLLDMLVGRKNYLIVVASAFCSESSPHYQAQWQLPHGRLSMERAHYLLSFYLEALYGRKDLVLGYSGGDFYLNEVALDSASLPLVEEHCARFLQQMEGVERVYTASALRGGGGSGYLFSRAEAGYHWRRSGHVQLLLEPGWLLGPVLAPGVSNARFSQTPGPLVLYFYGWKLHRDRVVLPTSQIDVVPTLCGLLQIGNPSTTQGQPIPAVVDWE